MKNQPKKSKKGQSYRRTQKLRGDVANNKRLRHWQLLAFASGAVVVVCLILLAAMGEL